MQPNLSDIPLGPRQPRRPSEPAELWMEAEDPDEVKKIEEQKKKQKALEKELSEKRKSNRNSRSKQVVPKLSTAVAILPPRRGAWERSRRGFGIAKILKKLQLHPRQGCHPVDVG